MIPIPNPKFLLALPTWLIARMLIPFVPQDHPWYGSRFTLKHWYEYETAFSVWMDVIIWSCICLLILSEMG